MSRKKACEFSIKRVYWTGIINMEILLLGALIVGLPIIILGLISYWRDKQYEKQAQ